MNYIFILPCMFFLHIVDDYYLQGILASLKQKSNWEKMDGYSEFYKHDYIAALLAHSFSWSFMVHCPIVFYFNGNFSIMNYFLSLIAQAVIHAFIDNEKANKKNINLVFDQVLHSLQICLTWLAFLQ